MYKFLIAITLFTIFNFCFSTTCRDGSTCPNAFTCCSTPEGVGCCPYENGNCCADKFHCCPNGFVCDNPGARCYRIGNEFLSYLETAPAKLEEVKQEKEVPSLPIVGFFNPLEILECVISLKPVVTNIMDIYKDYKNGNKDAIKNELMELAAKGILVGKACWKLI